MCVDTHDEKWPKSDLFEKTLVFKNEPAGGLFSLSGKRERSQPPPAGLGAADAYFCPKAL